MLKMVVLIIDVGDQDKHKLVHSNTICNDIETQKGETNLNS